MGEWVKLFKKTFAPPTQAESERSVRPESIVQFPPSSVFKGTKSTNAGPYPSDPLEHSSGQLASGTSQHIGQMDFAHL